MESRLLFAGLMLFYLCAVFMSTYLVHETAHMLVGAALGLRPSVMKLGPLEFSRSDRGIRCTQHKGRSTGTYTVFDLSKPCATAAWRSAVVWSSGLVASLGTAALCWLCWYRPDLRMAATGMLHGQPVGQFVQIFATGNLLMGLVELWPSRSHLDTHTDGHALLRLCARNLPDSERQRLKMATHGAVESPVGPLPQPRLSRYATTRLANAKTLIATKHYRTAVQVLRAPCHEATIDQLLRMDELFVMLAALLGLEELHPELDAATTRLVNYDPKNSRFVSLRSRALLVIGRRDQNLPRLMESLEELANQIRSDPGDRLTIANWAATVIATVGLITFLARSELYPYAGAISAELLAMDPNNPEYMHNHAVALHNLGGYEEVIALLEPVVCGDRSGGDMVTSVSIDNAFAMAVLHQADTGRYPLADRAANRSNIRTPNHLPFIHARAWILIETGHVAEGLALIDESSEAAARATIANRAEVLATAALGTAKLGDRQRATDLLAKAEALDPNCRILERARAAAGDGPGSNGPDLDQPQ